MAQISAEQQNYNLIGSRLSIMRSEIAHARNRRPKHMTSDVTAIVVTKDIFPEVIVKAYEEGQRHFGEYTIPELVTKSNCGVIKDLCPDIKWHYMGSLQVSRIGRLITGVRNMYMIHCIERPVDGDILQTAIRKSCYGPEVRVMVQVNTSRETNGNGVLPEDADMLVHHLLRFCPHLSVQGLMTVGSNKHDQRADFITLTHLREVLQKQFGETLEVVMGWSKDFKQAIQLGSNYIRMEERVFRPVERKYVPPKSRT